MSIGKQKIYNIELKNINYKSTAEIFSLVLALLLSGFILNRLLFMYKCFWDFRFVMHCMCFTKYRCLLISFWPSRVAKLVNRSCFNPSNNYFPHINLFIDTCTSYDIQETLNLLIKI